MSASGSGGLTPRQKPPTQQKAAKASGQNKSLTLLGEIKERKTGQKDEK
jgi:hypothetical protein